MGPRLGVAEIKDPQGCDSYWRLRGRICFQPCPGCWLNSAPCGCRTAVPIPRWLTAGGRSVLLEAAPVPSLACHVAPPATVLQICLPIPTSLSPAREISLLLRAHEIKVSLTGKSRIIPCLKAHHLDRSASEPLNIFPLTDSTLHPNDSPFVPSTNA